MAERHPPPPADLVGALHDSVHKDLREYREARARKVPPRPLEHPEADRLIRRLIAYLNRFPTWRGGNRDA